MILVVCVVLLFIRIRNMRKSLTNVLILQYSRYLFSIGTATSTATTTYFSGSIGIGTPASGVNGDLSACTITANNINTTTNLQENGVNLASTYLKYMEKYILTILI